jgi:tRNA A-37 threonylcarbamoyl transferase component Bud32
MSQEEVPFCHTNHFATDVKDGVIVCPTTIARVFVKENVEWSEFYIHRIVYDHGLIDIPKIIEYDHDSKTLTMQKIPEMSIADMYGDDEKALPPTLWTAIREILVKLSEIGINYPDITPYNFIEHDDKVWIIDFGHATIRSSTNNKPVDNFMSRFINGHNGWNEEFR